MEGANVTLEKRKGRGILSKKKKEEKNQMSRGYREKDYASLVSGIIKPTGGRL